MSVSLRLSPVTVFPKSKFFESCAMPLSPEQLIERFNARRPPTGILLGMTVLDVVPEAGRVRLSFSPDARFTNPQGMIQGGIVAAMLDDTAAYAGIVAMGEAGYITSLEFKTSFFAPAMPGLVYAEGRCLKMGRTACYLEADLVDEAGKLLARMSSTALAIRTARKPK
jgi:uncharacterized protein (TIGR00369 family)